MLTFFLKASRRPEEAYAWCGEACVRPQFLWLPHVVRVGFLEVMSAVLFLKDGNLSGGKHVVGRSVCTLVWVSEPWPSAH